MEYTFAERLKEYMEYFGLNKTDVSKIIKKNISNVGRYLNGSYEAKADVIDALCQRYGVDHGWMLGYDVPMFNDGKKETPTVDDSEREASELFNKLSEEEKNMILSNMRFLIANRK